MLYGPSDVLFAVIVLCIQLRKKINVPEFSMFLEHLQALLYYNRSLAFFRLKNYKSCVDDIKRAFANGKHDENRYWYRTSKNLLNLLIADNANIVAKLNTIY